MFKTISIAFLFFLFQSTSLLGQSYIMNHFTVKDGLPSNAIRSINEDAQGNLWIVTDNGVVKYNGSIFKTYNSFKNIKIGSVFDIYPASDGRVYLIDYVNNLDYIYNGQLHTINTGGIHLRVPYEQYGQVFGVDGIGNSYSIKGDSLVNINAAVSKLTLAKLFRKDDTSYPYVIVSYPYVVRIEGLKFTAVHIETGKVASAEYPTFDAPLTDGYGGVYRGKVYFVIHSKRIICYDPEKNIFYEKRLDDKNSLSYVARQIMYSKSGMQVTTNNGCLILDEYLRPVDSLRIDVQQEGIVSIFQDAARNFWLLTNSGLKSIGSYFRNVKIYPKGDNKSIAYFNGQLYIVRQNGNVSVYDTAMKLKEEIIIENALNVSHSPVFYSILERPDSLIIATNKNITVIKRNGSHYSLKLSASQIEMIKPVKDVIYYKDDLMVLTYEGICKINVQSGLLEFNKAGRYNKILTGINDSLFVCDKNSIYYVNKDVVTPFNKILGATPNGAVFPYSSPITDTIKKVTNFEIPDFLVSDEKYWIAASNEHVFTWNKLTRQVNRYKVNGKVSFLKIEKDNLWVATSSMLYRFVRNNSEAFKLHSKYYNFGYNLYQSIRDITSTATCFFLSTDYGIVKVSMSDVDMDKSLTMQVPVITKVIYGKYSYSNANDTVYKFDYVPSNLSINFSANTVGYDKDVTYRSYLEGVDRQWQTTSSPIVTYSALEPGTYRLHFKVSLDKYDLHSKEQVVTITIQPLWWQHTILRVVLASVILVILGLVLAKLILRRKNQMLQKALIEKNISSVKLSALQSQMNPHFIFNAMASIQSFVKQKKNDLAEESLTEFATLIRLYLEFSRKPLVSLEEELHTLLLYTSIETKRFDNKFDVDFDVKTERPHTEILLPPLIIQPYVENAISHGLYHKLNGRGRLDIVITEKDGEVEVIVDDNGIGREKANSINEGMKRGTSRGLQLINERIKILNDTGMIDVRIDITDKTDAGGQPEGTKVTIHFKN